MVGMLDFRQSTGNYCNFYRLPIYQFNIAVWTVDNSTKQHEITHPGAVFQHFVERYKKILHTTSWSPSVLYSCLRWSWPCSFWYVTVYQSMVVSYTARGRSQVTMMVVSF